MLKVIELFSGIGSQAKALNNLKIPYKIVATSDWDFFSSISYSYIHHNKEMKEYMNNIKRERERERERAINFLYSKNISRDGKKPISLSTIKKFNDKLLFNIYYSYIVSNNLGNIKNISGSNLPKHDLLTYSFPCQDLSLQGTQSGLINGKTSSLLWEVERILKELNNINRKPKYLLLENVFALFSKKHSNNLNKFLEFLSSLGYTNHKFILNSKYYNTPQNRKRAFVLSELNQNKYIVPSSNKLTSKTLKDIFSFSETRTEWKPSRGEILDWNPIKKESGLSWTKIENYTSYGSENTVFTLDSLAPTITATGARSRIKILYKDKKITMLTSKELWKLMGFSEQDWSKVKSIGIVPENYLIKQAGNSIVVNVLQAIFKNLEVNN